MTTRRVLLVTGLLAAMLGAWLVPAAAAPAPAPAFTTLDPGKPAKLTEKIPVQVVLLGYEEDLVPRATLEEYLPNYARPQDRRRTHRSILRNLGDQVYWDDPRIPPYLAELGLHYTFDHEVTYTDAAYEDAFFDHLLAIGVDERVRTGNGVSFPQHLYNQQPGRTVDITNNLVINAERVERWLLDHPAPGVDPSRNTVVLVNWWGRDDFRFHDYQPTAEKQSENGLNMPNYYWSGRMIAFGGTGAHDDANLGRPSRTWFHDLSAGPDLGTDNWVIDDTLGFGPDPATNTVYPPVWQYTEGGADDRIPLPDALGLITRFVAVNEFFANSPVYGYDTDAHMTSDIELDVTVHGNVAVSPSLLRDKVGGLLGRAPKLDVTRRPDAGPAAKCHEQFVRNQSCRPEANPATYPVDANFYLGAQRERSQWQDGSAGYEAPGFVYEAQRTRKWIGVAGDNWTDGNRTEVNSLLSPEWFEFGFGTTSTLIHEYGHHFGASHPHDGYETEWGPFTYAANDTSNGFFHFVWVASEVNSVMSYLNVNNDFSQFDVDNYQRWQAARYLRAANMISAQVLRSARANAGAARLAQADASFTAAQQALHAHDYRNAEARAAEGYAHARAAAEAARVVIPTVDRWATETPGGWHGENTKLEGFHPSAEPVEDKRAARTIPSGLIAQYEATRN